MKRKTLNIIAAAGVLFFSAGTDVPAAEADSETIEAFYLAQNGLLTADQKKSFDELPPEEQKRIQKNYQKFQKLPEPKKDALKERYRRWEDLPPETKEELRRELREKQGKKK